MDILRLLTYNITIMCIACKMFTINNACVMFLLLFYCYLCYCYLFFFIYSRPLIIACTHFKFSDHSAIFHHPKFWSSKKGVVWLGMTLGYPIIMGVLKTPLWMTRWQAPLAAEAITHKCHLCDWPILHFNPRTSEFSDVQRLQKC